MDGLNREELLELKEFLTERMVDNMSTKELVEYVAGVRAQQILEEMG